MSEKSTVAIQLNSETYIKLEVFDNGKKIIETEGRTCATIPALFFYPTTKKDKVIHVEQGL